MVLLVGLPFAKKQYTIITYLDIINLKEKQNMLYLPREEGQGLVEYALILVLVAVVVIIILALLGPAIGNIFSNIINNL
jgi:pilus assembly protein Flp/PilA